MASVATNHNRNPETGTGQGRRIPFISSIARVVTSVSPPNLLEENSATTRHARSCSSRAVFKSPAKYLQPWQPAINRTKTHTGMAHHPSMQNPMTEAEWACVRVTDAMKHARHEAEPVANRRRAAAGQARQHGVVAAVQHVVAPQT